MPRIARPSLTWSSVAAGFATSPGLRNVFAPTSSPSRIRSVAPARRRGWPSPRRSAATGRRRSRRGGPTSRGGRSRARRRASRRVEDSRRGQRWPGSRGHGSPIFDGRFMAVGLRHAAIAAACLVWTGAILRRDRSGRAAGASDAAGERSSLSRAASRGPARSARGRRRRRSSSRAVDRLRLPQRAGGRVARRRTTPAPSPRTRPAGPTLAGLGRPRLVDLDAAAGVPQRRLAAAERRVHPRAQPLAAGEVDRPSPTRAQCQRDAWARWIISSVSAGVRSGFSSSVQVSCRGRRRAGAGSPRPARRSSPRSGRWLCSS